MSQRRAGRQPHADVGSRRLRRGRRRRGARPVRRPHLVAAIQPNAADQARVAALNMAGRQVELPGVLAINVLDTLGLISSSFGQWEGGPDKDGVELVDGPGIATSACSSAATC